MGAQIEGFYKDAELAGGLQAKIRLSLLTKTYSGNALFLVDSPQNITLFESALKTIRTE